ncbi:DedA family protein [Patescibacteria group bacterium]|nr:DedA family protein [Patescibacteria group bacterium]
MISEVINFILHIDAHLVEIVQNYGLFTYAILFLIIFAETGFVFTPFLPGDSLLFAAGAIAAIGNLNILVIWVILVFAAILGDTANYWIGHFFGKKILSKNIPLIKKEHVDKTNKFYEKHGGKTIILARFIPIIRTFAPFVAGIGKMHYSKFLSYNVIGGILWISIFSFTGFFFGNIAFVKHNFSLVVIAIILISILPMILEIVKSKRKK